MIQRRPEMRQCPFLAGQVCLAEKCMLYHVEPNSPTAYCQLTGVGNLGSIANRLNDLQIAACGIGRLLERIASQKK